MSIKKFAQAVASAAVLFGVGTAAHTAAAAPLVQTQAATASTDKGAVQNIRHRGWGGVGIYIGPSYGGYYDGYYGYPRYRTYGYRYSDGYYDRPYRYRHYHHRRWARERFEHPLGRR